MCRCLIQSLNVIEVIQLARSVLISENCEVYKKIMKNTICMHVVIKNNITNPYPLSK